MFTAFGIILQHLALFQDYLMLVIVDILTNFNEMSRNAKSLIALQYELGILR